MASVPNPTFGCGNFLPGFGPHDVPRYDGPYSPIGVPGGGIPGVPGGPDPPDPPEPDEYHYCCKGSTGGPPAVQKGHCVTKFVPGGSAPPSVAEVCGVGGHAYPLGSPCLEIDLGDPINNPYVPQKCYDPPPPPPFNCRCCIIDEETNYDTKTISDLETGVIITIEEIEIRKIRECRDVKIPCTYEGGVEKTIEGNIANIQAAGYKNIKKMPANSIDNEECPVKDAVLETCCENDSPGAAQDCCPEVILWGEKTTIVDPDPTYRTPTTPGGAAQCACGLKPVKIDWSYAPGSYYGENCLPGVKTWTYTWEQECLSHVWADRLKAKKDKDTKEVNDAVLQHGSKVTTFPDISKIGKNCKDQDTLACTKPCPNIVMQYEEIDECVVRPGEEERRPPVTPTPGGETGAGGTSIIRIPDPGGDLGGAGGTGTSIELALGVDFAVNNSNPTVGEQITFEVTPNPPIATLESANWIFDYHDEGGNVVDTAQDPYFMTHTYTQAGLYSVWLQVQDDGTLYEHGIPKNAQELKIGYIDVKVAGPGGGNAPKSLPPPFGRAVPEIPPKSVLYGKRKDPTINLNHLSNQTSWGLTQDTQAGPFDPDIDLSVPQRIPGNPVVKNTLDLPKNIFSRNIGTGIDYTIRNSNLFTDWNNGYGYQVNPQTIIRSINPQLIDAFKKMKKVDGSKFTRTDVYTIFKNRILDGTFNSLATPDLNFDAGEFFKLATKTKDLQIPNIERSTNAIQNQGGALAWLELNSVPADVNGPPARHINKVMNWKFLPTDINMYIPISVGGTTKNLFVKDDGTFSPYSTLIVQDGDYIIVNGKKLFCNTERDHAIIPSEGARQTASKLLGGTGQINLTVSSPHSARVEYSNNLNLSGEDPRDQIIFAKLEASSIATEETPQSLLYKTKATYKVVDTTTAQGLREFNEYIKYKFFHRTFTMAWDDLFLDHLEHAGKYEVESEDIIFNAPKTNKTLPLLTRHIPYYIGILPTNRQTYLPFNEKSIITQLDVDTNIVERTLKIVPTLDPDLWKDTPFIQTKLGWPVGNKIDIFGKTNIQNIISEYNPSATVYKQAYKVDGRLTTGTDVPRNKKLLRILYDIVVNNLDKNYVLEKQGIGRGVYWFDIFSRLTLTEFNRFTFLSNAPTLLPTIAKGLYANIKILSPLKYAGEVAFNKTCLLRRKEGASEDTFPQVKKTNITRQRFLYSSTGVRDTSQSITNKERTEAKRGRTAPTLS
jgi:hypothetical protein